jgi:hypothetical protein
MIRRVLAFALAFGVVASATVKADAHARRHHHRYYHFARSSHRSRGEHVDYQHAGFSLVTVNSAAGSITVNAAHASQFVGAIADLVAAGFRGPVHCYARGGHVRHSLHYTGEACDFAQTGRNRVASGAGIMFHAHVILARWGLRDGCTFHDCGHADTGRTFAALERRRYAETPRRRYAEKSARRPAESMESAQNTELWAWHDGSQDNAHGKARKKVTAGADGWREDANGRKDWDNWSDENQPRRVAEYRHPHRYR